MSLLMVAGSVGNYSIVYAANAFKAGDSFKIKYTHNNKISTKKAVDARWNGKVLGTKMPGYIDENDNAMYSAYWYFWPIQRTKGSLIKILEIHLH